MRSLQVLRVKEYNRLEMIKYNKRIEAWKNERFENNPIPFYGFYGFRLPNGELRQRGFVVIKGGSHFFFPTKNKLFGWKRGIANF